MRVDSELVFYNLNCRLSIINESGQIGMAATKEVDYLGRAVLGGGGGGKTNPKFREIQNI